MTRAAEGPAHTGTGPTDETPATKLALSGDGSAGHRPVPLYRSAEWHALPTTDPRKSAAVWNAANAWAAYWSDTEVARRLADELEQLDREVTRRIRATSYEVAVGMNWSALASRPTHAELARRRAEVPDGPCGSPRCRGCSRCIRAAAVARNGGDYRGAASTRRNRGAA